MRHAIVLLEDEGSSALSKHIPAPEPIPIVSVLKPTTAAGSSIAGPVHLHTTGGKGAAQGAAAPIPPRLTPTAVARGDIVGAIQLRGTGRRRQARRVVRGLSASRRGERSFNASGVTASIQDIMASSEAPRKMMIDGIMLYENSKHRRNVYKQNETTTPKT